MTEEHEGIQSQVLLDTEGDVVGIVADANNTWIYYSVNGSGVYRVLDTGRSIGMVTEFATGSLGGMDIDEEHDYLYFADASSGGGVYRTSCGVEQDKAQMLSISDAWGVAYDTLSTLLYVSQPSTGTIFSVDVQDLPDLSGDATSVVATGIDSLKGIAIDPRATASVTLFLMWREEPRTFSPCLCRENTPLFGRAGTRTRCSTRTGRAWASCRGRARTPRCCTPRRAPST